jgi:hypothetical protein
MPIAKYGGDHNVNVAASLSAADRGHRIETIYWTGSLEETRELAKGIARQLAADDFQIFEFNTDARVWLGSPPSFH